jgi:AcrR family transcriptional regulator
MAGRVGGVAAPSGSFGEVRVREFQRARILAAMVEACGECSAANVSVAHVVERAGVSRRTFYELFDDREDCFLSAFDDAIARACRYVLDSYDPRARWVERVRGALVGLLAFLDCERGAGRLLIVDSLGAGTRALARRRDALAHAHALVDEGRRHAGAGRELPVLTAEGIVGGVLSVLHARLIEPCSPAPPPNAVGLRAGRAPALRLPAGKTPAPVGFLETTEGPEGAPVGFVGLTGSLMSMVVLPYLGPAAARRELARPTPPAPSGPVTTGPLREPGMRLTYRTMRVLLAVAANPGGSNRQVADSSGITDQGQISKLLARLRGFGLVENTGASQLRGAPNSWVLTDHGWQVQATLTHSTAA